jgi:hypothetical protein
MYELEEEFLRSIMSPFRVWTLSLGRWTYLASSDPASSKPILISIRLHLDLSSDLFRFMTYLYLSHTFLIYTYEGERMEREDEE